MQALFFTFDRHMPALSFLLESLKPVTNTRHGQNRVRVVPQDAEHMRSSGSASDLEIP